MSRTKIEPRPDAGTSPESTCVPLVRCNDLLVAAEHEAVLRDNGLDSLEALFKVREAELLSKPGLDPWRERLRLIVKGDKGEQRTFYLKRFVRPPASALRVLRSSDTGARSLAGLEWAWIDQLTRDGIACPSPVALGEEWDGMRACRSVLVTAAVGGQALESWVHPPSRVDRARVRGLLGPLAALVARLHGLGYVHRDLYLSHVFWNPEVALPASLHLIDLQRIMRPRWMGRRWIVKDLAALNFSTPLRVASAADRIRWLKHYLGVSKLDRAAKCLAYRVVGKTLAMARHERRRAARLVERSERR